MPTNAKGYNMRYNHMKHVQARIKNKPHLEARPNARPNKHPDKVERLNSKTCLPPKPTTVMGWL